MSELKKTINLYEYQNKEEFKGGQKEFEAFLDEIWQKRIKSNSYFESELTEEDRIDNDIRNKQKFITFLSNGYIKSRKYIGTIIWNGNRINLFPKIFFQEDDEVDKSFTKLINFNILWWLSYAKKKINFPNFPQSMSDIEFDFFEVLIYLFAKYTNETLSYSIYQTYQEVEEELSYVKGRIDWNAYINNNLATGNWQKINCIYEPFELDNHFNRIIKYVAKILHSTSVIPENKKLLSDIIFILDEVSDIKATIYDCEKVKLNPVFENFITVLDYCKLFLSNSVSISENDSLELFAFLIPMEVLFEEFVSGFLQKHCNDGYDWISESTKKLTTDGEFHIKNDIFSDSKKIIIDTKYKILQTDDNNKKQGVSQNDLYQIIAYAIRRKCKELYLVYPYTINDYESNDPSLDVLLEKKLEHFKVIDKFSKVAINIHPVRIPIINYFINDELVNGQQSSFNFDKIEEKLKLLFSNLFKQKNKEKKYE